MTGDGYIGIEKFLYDKSYIAQIISTTKAKHFTVIGLTNVFGELIFCIVIVEGKEQLFVVGMELIYLSRKLEIRVMDNNTFK